MKVVTDWLTKVYDFQWYYTYDDTGKILSAKLLKRKPPHSVVELHVTVVDNRDSYYEKVLMRE